MVVQDNQSASLRLFWRPRRPGLAGRAPERADGMGGHRGRCADLQQYTLAAERRSVLSGRRSFDLPVLTEALRRVRPYAGQGGRR